jgi:Spy/CpxP family protein refolding chaperone
MKSRTILSLAACGAIFAGLAFTPTLRAQLAQEKAVAAQAEPETKSHKQIGNLLKKLNLTEDQKAGALAILRNRQPTLKPLVDSLVNERVALYKLGKATDIDEGAIRTQFARVAAVEADLEVQKAYLMKDLRAILTPKQIKKLDKFEAKTLAQIVGVIAFVNAWIANS